MKIIIPILGFAKAGGYRVLSKLATEWVRMGHHVDFLIPSSSEAPYFPTEAGIYVSDRGGTINPYGEVGVTTTSALDSLRCIYAGISEIGGRYDVILANHSLTTWPIWLAASKINKLFYYIQAYEPEYFALERKYIAWCLSRLSYNLPFKHIANSTIYDGFKGINPVAIIPPGLDLELYHKKNDTPNFESASTITVGTISRHELAKGTIYALDGFAKAYEKDNRLRLNVAYDNLPENWSHPACEVTIPRNDTELADYYRSIDILIASGTAQHGAFHYPVMEAMACGTAVITTGYMPADQQNSWIVQNRSADSISNAICDVLSDGSYKSKTDRACGAVSQYAWQILATNMATQFQKLK